MKYDGYNSLRGSFHCGEIPDSDIYITVTRDNFWWVFSHPIDSYANMKHRLSGSVSHPLYINVLIFTLQEASIYYFIRRLLSAQ